MLEKAKKHTVTAVGMLGCLLTLLFLAYLGCVNLPNLYKEWGVTEYAEATRTFIVNSYLFMTISWLGILLGLFLGNAIGKQVNGQTIHISFLFKFSWIWVIVILLSPAIVLSQIAIDKKYSVVATNILIAFAVMTGISMALDNKSKIVLFCKKVFYMIRSLLGGRK
ncbi:hypothetical protein B4086_5743 [Bacillus cereus]|nr:hypothetical protein B4086_5743 [Bacillus cereus]